MSAVRDAIQARLVGDSALVALLGTPTASVFHRKMPQSSKLPVVIYDKRTGSRVPFFAGAPLRYETWMVKGVAFGRTADRAEAIGERIEAVMTDLTITGHICLDVRLETEIDYPEQFGKELIQHIGGVYRIILQ